MEGGLWVFGSLLPSVAGLAVMVVHASPTVWQIDYVTNVDNVARS